MVKRKDNHSKFWTGNYFDTFNRSWVSDMEKLQQLANAKRAIANFVSISTGKSIPVRFKTGGSYTNSEVVVIGKDITSPKDFDVAVGLALHEASHIVHTDFNSLRRLQYKISDDMYRRASMAGQSRDGTQSYVKDILNVIEDRRLDSLSFKGSPGYREYYLKMYDAYFNYPVIDKALLSDEFTDETFESYMFRLINLHNPKSRGLALKSLPEIIRLIDLKNIDRLKNTDEVLELALQVFEVILSAVEQQKAQSDDSEEDQGDQKSKSGNGDSEKSDDTDQEESENDGSGSEGGDGDSDEDSDGDEDGDGDGDEDGDSNGGFDGEGDTDQDDNGQESASASATKENQLSPNQRKQLATAIKKQKKFIEGTVDKKRVGAAEAKDLRQMEESGTTIEKVGGDEEFRGRKIDVITVATVTPSMIENGDGIIIAPRSYYKDEVAEGVRKGVALAKKLQIRSEVKTTVYNRQKTGKIDKRMVSSLGFGNQSVFYFNEVDEYKDANLHISIDGSSSMSGIKWQQTLINITAIVTAIDKIPGLDVQVDVRATKSELPYVVKVYDSRVDSLSKVKKLFPKLVPCGTTPESLCFEAIFKTFVSSTNKRDSYFLNISDGQPYFISTKHGFTYEDGPAIAHTRKQVKKIKAKGIKILSYFVSEANSRSYESQQFKEMYGDAAAVIDITSVNEIVKTLNKLFLSK